MLRLQPGAADLGVDHLDQMRLAGHGNPSSTRPLYPRLRVRHRTNRGRIQIVRPRRKFGEVPDDLIANHEPCGARTIEPSIGTDLPRRLSSERPPNSTP